MQRYVLTERGKLLIAMLIMLVLFLTSLTLVIWLFTRDSAPENTFNGSSDIPQNNISFSSSEPSPDIPYDSPQVSSSGETSEPLSPDSSLAGPIAFDFDAGLLTFLFTPDSQTAVDEDSVSKIGELLKSPKNERGAKIAVEIPQLSDDDTALITAAIIDAFEVYNIPLSSVVFFVYQPEPNLKTFAISISFR